MSRVLTECLKGLSYFRIAVMSLGWISDRFSGYVTRSCMGYVWTHWLVGYWMTLSVADVTLRRVVAWLMGNKPESISNQALLAWFKDNIPRVFLKEFRKPTNNLSTQQSRCLGRFETDTSKTKVRIVTIWANLRHKRSTIKWRLEKSLRENFRGLSERT